MQPIYLDYNAATPLGDALHLALASYHRCDFLLTWNLELQPSGQCE